MFLFNLLQLEVLLWIFLLLLALYLATCCGETSSTYRAVFCLLLTGLMDSSDSTESSESLDWSRSSKLAGFLLNRLGGRSAIPFQILKILLLTLALTGRPCH
jgi:hypothetical protein